MQTLEKSLFPLISGENAFTRLVPNEAYPVLCCTDLSCSVSFAVSLLML